MRRARRVWRRVVTEVRWLRDRHRPLEPDTYGPDPVDAPVDEHGHGPLAWAREEAARPYDWSTFAPHDFDDRMWPGYSVRAYRDPSTVPAEFASQAEIDRRFWELRSTRLGDL